MSQRSGRPRGRPDDIDYKGHSRGIDCSKVMYLRPNVDAILVSCNTIMHCYKHTMKVFYRTWSMYNSVVV